MYRVTSDCKPWKKGGYLSLCDNCHTIQCFINDNYKSDVNIIYHDYSVYHQSGGYEQQVFIEGSPVPRSQRIIEAVMNNYSIPSEGRILDIGCGNGSFLRKFHTIRPNFLLSGSEISDRDVKVISSIPNFEKLWCCQPYEISGRYEIISMIHLLEHIISPVSFLKEVREKLSADGVIIIEVPNYCKNPFDLIIADHATHFSLNSLYHVVQQSGFEVIWSSDSNVPKEITLIARKSDVITYHITAGNDERNQLEKSLGWLEKMRDEAKGTAENDPVGIFGSSIAATWIFCELEGNVAFFVDEDPNRIGRSHLGRPILSLAEVPDNVKVIIPAPEPVKSEIERKMRKNSNTSY
ncbi:class I SAM-dependent methyltransferase [Methanospirillum sp.]|uniref:class I SAM-dependent methyltransferase n=1 Tax=Methanospirillum sp. TaxID=45200 RepID=UPI00359F774D